MKAIEDFYQVTDPDYAPGIPDYYPAICRAQSQSNAENTKYPYLGFSLVFQAKQYYFSKPIELIRNMHLMGSGASADNPTMFILPENSPGIIVHSDASYRNSTYVDINLMGTFFEDNSADFSSEKRGDGSIIERIGISCDLSSPIQAAEAVTFIYDPDYSNTQVISVYEDGYFPDRRSHGITAFCRVTIRDVSIYYFACHAIYLWGIGAGKDNDPDRKYQSANVIQSKVDNCILSTCGGDGVHIFGGAASSCIINSVTTAHLKGWSFADFSRIGNNFIACNSNDLNCYLRPQNLTFPNLNNDNYIKKIINAWYEDIVDENLNITNPAKYADKFLEIKSTDKFYITFGHGIFIDCYADGGRSFISPSNVVIGSGNLGNLGTPAKLDTTGHVARLQNGLSVYGFQNLNEAQAAQEDFTVTTLGGNSATFPNLSIEFDFTQNKSVQTSSNTYRLLFEERYSRDRKNNEMYKGWWELASIDPPGGHQLSYKTPLRLSTSNTDINENGQIWFENGFYIGAISQEDSENQRVKVISAKEAPSAGVWKNGDRVLNTNPDPSDINPDPLKNKSYSGWIFTSAGWKPFGKIEL